METESAKQTQRHLGTEKTRGQSESSGTTRTQAHPQSLTGCCGLLPLTSHLLSSSRNHEQALWSKSAVAREEEPS